MQIVCWTFVPLLLQHLCDVWQAGPPIAANQQSGSSSSISNPSSSNGGNQAGAAAVSLEYDGILGFSNGAAAAFLFAAHAAANIDQFKSLRFVALAGGYVPEPLDKLIPQQLLQTQNNTQSNSQCDNSYNEPIDIPPVDRLVAKLPFPSLHMMGSNDPLMDVADSSQLMDCFQQQGRYVILFRW